MTLKDVVLNSHRLDPIARRSVMIFVEFFAQGISSRMADDAIDSWLAEIGAAYQDWSTEDVQNVDLSKYEFMLQYAFKLWQEEYMKGPKKEQPERWVWLKEAEAAIRSQIGSKRPSYPVSEDWVARTVNAFIDYCMRNDRNPYVAEKQYQYLVSDWLKLYILENDPVNDDHKKYPSEKFREMWVETKARETYQFKSEQAIDRFAGWASKYYPAILEEGSMAIYTCVGSWRTLYEYEYL